MIRKLLLTVIVLTVTLTAWSQSGTMKGKVTDKETKEPIPFANVVIELGGKIINGGTTDFEGNYNIKPIPPGRYDVKVTYVGYKNLMVQGVIINADKIRFLDVVLESTTTTLETFEVVDYKVPLIDKDQTSTGGTMTSEEITRMAGRSATSVAITVGGVFADENGSMGGMRGQRSEGTATYIDGVRVIGSSALPQAAIDQVAVITGGTPAMYGDLTGGIVNITTKGPSRQFGAGFEAVTSELLDGYGYNLLGFMVNGPLIKGKDSTKNSALLGYFISGEGSYIRDGNPASIGTYKVNDDMLDYLRKNPVRPSGTGFGSYNNSEFVHFDDLENLHTRLNAENYSVNLSGKIDVRTTDYTNLTFGGSVNYAGGSNWSLANTLYNYDNNGVYNQLTYRVYGKFTQRFPTAQDSRSLIKNVFYSIQADYTHYEQTVESNLHGDNLFNYGYVGKFDTYTVNSYEYGSDTVLGFDNVWIHNGFRDTLYNFTRSEINPYLSNYTDQFYHLYDPSSGLYANRLLVQSGGALLNGELPNAVYGLWANTGTPYNGYSLVTQSRIGFNANGSADVGNHAFQFGLQYEQRSTSSFSANPAGLWTLMRGLTNRHIEQLDLANPLPVFDQNGVFQDTINYNRLYDGNTQAYFDKMLRELLGYSVTGLDWLDLDSYDPSIFSLDMFSPDELLNNGNLYVNYYGYDHTGKKLKSKPAFEDFFTKVDENGNLARSVGAYEPIYIAGYIQDQFSINDLIFTIGVRVDRFDANQKVLKDPFLLSEAKTVKETKAEGAFGGSVPTNMGDDYVVYVNDLYNPTAILGYRDGSVWYNAQGEEVTDPTTIETASGIAPYLIDPSNNRLSSTAFKDYDPQTTFMPRISFSFPISDEALFFAHYDVLTSRPTTGNRLDLISYFFLSELGTSVVNNPNLKPERTTDYELGFQQKLTNSSSLRFSAYYRELRDQIQVYRFAGAYPTSYISYNNIDFGTVKGLTVQYDLRQTKNLWMKVSYTLQFANATGSSATSGVNLARTGMPNLRTLSPISEDRNHQINIIADYRYGRGKKYNGPTITKKVKGTDQVKIIRLLENTGANLTFRGGSGLPYSRQSNVTPIIGGQVAVLEGSLNGSRLPWQFAMDLRIDRDFYLKSKNKKSAHYLNIYLLVLNVLNTQNVMGVYRYTGNPDDDGYLQAAEFQSQINSSLDPTAYRDLYSVRINNPYNYSLPRRIRVGVQFNF